MSERQEVAVRLGDLVSAMRMVTPIGGYLGQSDEKGKPHIVGFSKPRNLDGTIHVYSPKFIRVSLQCRYLDMPHRFNAVFCSEADAGKFLTHLARHEFEEALKVRTK